MPGLGFTLLVDRAPAPQPVLDAVQEIEIECSLEVASVVRVRFGIAQNEVGDWSILQEDLFRPLVPLGVRIDTGLGVPQAVVNGFVSAAEVTWSESAGGSVLEVTGLDATALMNLEEKVTQWPNLPDTAIAAAILGQYGLVPQVGSSSPVLVQPEGTTIQRGTDIRFLRRLALRNGFDCYVQPEPLTGLDFGHFEPRQTSGLPQAVLNVAMREQTNVSDFAIRYDMLRPTTVNATGLDASSKQSQPAPAPAPEQAPLGAEPALLRVPTTPVVRPVDTGLPRTAELRTAAQAIVDRSSWAIAASGQAGPDVGLLRPGGIVNIRGVGDVYSGSYVVTTVRHTLSADGWTQRFEASRNALRATGGELFAGVG